MAQAVNEVFSQRFAMFIFPVGVDVLERDFV